MSTKKKPDPIVCHCLGITEQELARAIRMHKICSIDDVTHHTQAGDGCTACHPMLKKLLAQGGYLPSSSSPIFSVK